MKYLIRLIQIHETFRVPEVESLAVLAGVDLQVVSYSEASPFCIVSLRSEQDAKDLIARSILSYGIYELWGSGIDYASLHASVKSNNAINLSAYAEVSFRFTMDAFQGKRAPAVQKELIESFSYLPFDGPIRMQGADLDLCIFEEYEFHASSPRLLYLGRWIAKSDRDAVIKYNLKKRPYISRTSMDAELSLVTANLALAAPGKIVYDPFVGTGSFSVACAHFGAAALGSDIDGRSIRGSNGVNVQSNFAHYGIANNYLDNFIADLTHTPLRSGRFLDGVICDPPYGVREGPKVLGNRVGRPAQLILIDGRPAHLNYDYIPPKRPYGFDDMMCDVLNFAYQMVVDHGRLCMWMPTANDEDIDLAIPAHPGLKIVSVSVQKFNKWSRRLLTYERLPESSLSNDNHVTKRDPAIGVSANDLNRFRRKYFEGFRAPSES